MDGWSGALETSYGGMIRLVTAIGCAVLLVSCQTMTPPKPKTADMSGPTVPAPPEATQPMQPQIAAADAAFRFDQILGVPSLQQDTLARYLASSARARNIKLVRRADSSAPYRVLGYLSAVGGDAGVEVTFVWDIVDAQNNRVHRVTGVEVAATASADPWSGVSDPDLQDIAARTIEDIYAWVNRLPAPPQRQQPATPAAASAKLL